MITLQQAVLATSQNAVEVRSWLPETHVSMLEVIAVYAGIVGLPIALWGIWKAWKEAKNAQAASRAAADAVCKFRDDLGKVDVIAELNRFIDGVSDVKRYLRVREMHSVVPDRLTDLKRLLINCRSASLFSDEAAQTDFQAAIAFFATLENNVESLLSGRRDSMDFARAARDISSHAEKIQGLLVLARTTIGTYDI